MKSGDAAGQSHRRDFLSAGSMGHCSSVALGIALQKPNQKIWCIDGDGAALMHLGAWAVTGAAAPDNLVHIIINNCAHESVGGMPTVAGSVDFAAAARACGYPHAVSAASYEELEEALAQAVCGYGLRLIEARCACGSRKDLGRPSAPPSENRRCFMEALLECAPDEEI